MSATAATETGHDTIERERTRAGELAGKYMTFKLADETYAIEILSVREIIRLTQITKVPRARAFVRGVINLRGRVIPVIDLRLKLEMPRAEPTEQSVIVVLQCAAEDRQLTMGVLVDQVLEVLSVEASDVEGPPVLAEGAADATFILGVAKAQKHVVFLLDIARVLAGGEASEVASLAV